MVSGDSPQLIHRFFTEVVEADPSFEPDKESLVVFCLDTRLALRGWHLVALGTLNQCNCGIREVLRPVLLTGSYGLVLAHNHLIIGKGVDGRAPYFSFREHGMIV